MFRTFFLLTEEFIKFKRTFDKLTKRVKILEQSSASSDIILESPNGTLYKVSVNNEGALETTVTASGTPSTPVLTAPDNSQWSLGVNNAGALVTTAI